MRLGLFLKTFHAIIMGPPGSGKFQSNSYMFILNVH